MPRSRQSKFNKENNVNRDDSNNSTGASTNHVHGENETEEDIFKENYQLNGMDSKGDNSKEDR